MSYCPRCGKPVNIGQAFCRACGVSLDERAASGPIGIIGSAPMSVDIRGGRYALLTGVLMVGLFSIIVLIIAPVFGFLMGAFISLIGTELVYEDAMAVNRVRRLKAVDPLGWSLFTFCLWIVAIPWYLFSKRKVALGLVQPIPSR